MRPWTIGNVLLHRSELTSSRESTQAMCLSTDYVEHRLEIRTEKYVGQGI